MPYENEILKRRTFAIISHPDAGKTTLTEKLLLFGGAIQVAGAVKSNKIKKTATSDFLDIEKQRGISVATSVMTFEYNNLLINLLDTPGHKDFAEDTYRTLTAVDSVILVIDCVKGVEPQTEALMEVCRMRNTPVMVFINKLDREGRNPFDLLDEIEQKLNIRARPLSWPAGMGFTFKGVYNLYNNGIYLFNPEKKVTEENRMPVESVNDPLLDSHFGTEAVKLREDIQLIEGVYDLFDKEKYLAGKLAPVFFGSALNNFGVKELLDSFTEISPPPGPRIAEQRIVAPAEKTFTGFVFKIHANIDPRHRDRIAFLRVCSGKFERGRFYYHNRLDREIRFNNPYTFLASAKSVVDEAYPGDVVGLYDTGIFKIGDTLTEGEHLQFKGISRFSPEIFKEVINTDPMKSKQFEKGISQLTDEGVAQLFTQPNGPLKVIGTVGELQFEVIQHRLLNEYGASCKYHPLNVYKACWITAKDKSKMDEFIRFKMHQVMLDKDGYYVYLADSSWMLEQMIKNNPDIEFHFNSDTISSSPVLN
ncbi:MAG: peptide chain release factor 3 [Bacteroidia bacterium]|nr:peptide chain release factor 3 [Bacteroidia bacterium]